MFDEERMCTALKSLRSHNDIIIIKLDKGFGVVVVDKSNYVIKMKKIFHDTTKFKLIDPSCNYDDALQVDSKIQRRLLQFKKDGLLQPSAYKAIKPTGSQ